MFSLIITIISIALVAALALATIYYGGSAFNKGSAEAKASQLINEGQQINGAVAMAKADVSSGTRDGATITDVASLAAAGYLAQVPSAWDKTVPVNTTTGILTTVVAAAPSDAVCKEVEKKATGVAVEGMTLGTAAVAGQSYGCFDDATDGNTVYFRF